MPGKRAFRSTFSSTGKKLPDNGTAYIQLSGDTSGRKTLGMLLFDADTEVCAVLHNMLRTDGAVRKDDPRIIKG